MVPLFRLIFMLSMAAFLPAYAISGEVSFNNRLTPIGLDGPVTLNSTGEGPGPSYSAAIYVVTPQGLKLVPESITTFRDPAGAKPAVSRYINAKTVAIPNTVPGSPATLRMRAWLTAEGSYENAKPNHRGESKDIVINKLGSPGPGFPANFPTNFTGFVIQDGPRAK